jgi:hypothetical protein
MRCMRSHIYLSVQQQVSAKFGLQKPWISKCGATQIHLWRTGEIGWPECLVMASFWSKEEGIEEGESLPSEFVSSSCCTLLHHWPAFVGYIKWSIRYSEEEAWQHFEQLKWVEAWRWRCTQHDMLRRAERYEKELACMEAALRRSCPAQEAASALKGASMQAL